jgi:iron(III) transport system permease protein
VSAFWGRLALGLALIAALGMIEGWPAWATARAAWQGSEPAVGAGLLGAPAWISGGAGGTARPLGLAFETVRLVVATEAIALAIGLPLALLLFRTDLWGRRVWLGLMALGLFVPMPLHAVAWLGAIGNAGRAQLFGGRRLLEGWSGAAFVHAMAAIPWVVLLVGVGLRMVEPELEESALLDLPAWRVLARVTLRRTLGAIAGAALAVAVLTAGDMTVTDLLQVRTYAEEAYVQFQLGNGPGAAAAVTLPPLGILGVLVGVAARRLLRADPARIPSPAARARLWRLNPGRRALGWAAAALVGGWIAVPICGLLWRAGRVGGAAALGQAPHWSLPGLLVSTRLAFEDVRPCLLKSFLLASLAASITAALAWALAWVSRRAGPWRWGVAASVALALATPGPVAGMALVLAYHEVPLIYDTVAIVLLAFVLRTLPYALLVLWPALRSIPGAYLESAALDGYGPWGQVRRVAIPETRGAILAAWGVAFVLAMGELPAVNLVQPPSRTTLLAVRVWELLHVGVESRLAGVGLIMLAAIAAAGLLAVGALGRLYAPDAIGLAGEVAPEPAERIGQE